MVVTLEGVAQGNTDYLPVRYWSLAHHCYFMHSQYAVEGKLPSSDIKAAIRWLESEVLEADGWWEEEELVNSDHILIGTEESRGDSEGRKKHSKIIFKYDTSQKTKMYNFTPPKRFEQTNKQKYSKIALKGR